MTAIARLKAWAKRLKTQLILLWLCCRQADMPLAPKLVALTTVAYAFSPIDLIPDFIPLLGYLDDLLLVPLGISLALRLTPPALLDRCQAEAQRLAGTRIAFNGRWLAAALVVLLWAGALGAGVYLWLAKG